jgi:hypothetical protein
MPEQCSVSAATPSTRLRNVVRCQQSELEGVCLFHAPHWNECSGRTENLDEAVNEYTGVQPPDLALPLQRCSGPSNVGP